jgi:2,3-bisphosphoglycerate-independent phosphoglycerate mutase
MIQKYTKYREDQLLQLEKFPTVLVILDGLGISKEKTHNAFYQAKTPTLDYLEKKYFYALLDASGEAVGLPQNYIGNSEVGHLTIGAGQIIPQNLLALEKITQPEKLKTNKKFLTVLSHRTKSSSIHIIGMISDAGVHSHIDHMKNIILSIQDYDINIPIILHLILDGRDSPPQSAQIYIKEIKNIIKKGSIKIGSVHGRFYAMDRDKNQERTKMSGAVFIKKQNISQKSVEEYIEKQYAHKISDEYIEPAVFIKNHTIKDTDIVIHTNYRLDRIVQLAKFIQTYARPSKTITPVPYPKIRSYSLYTPLPITETFFSILNKNNKKFLSIAESEKHAHISYFFNGGKHTTFENETRVFIASKKEISFAKNPEMSADEITQTVLDRLEKNDQNFYLINYANADMVGHSGDFRATIQAIEFLDTQIKKLYQAIVLERNGTLFITADHGNAESMFDEKNKQEHRAHTSNPVPFFAINAEPIKIKMQGLKDVAPCILEHLKINR